MFEGFKESMIDAGETVIRARQAGNGPPLLLLHGNPQTSAMWHKVAPRLAETFTVVATDLRGYGESGKPPSAPDHAPYSKRAMAREDRKSTRLNSSHVAISYAVFCLKKKKKNIEILHLLKKKKKKDNNR